MRTEDPQRNLPLVTVSLSQEQVAVLAPLARHYARTMGPARRVFRVFAPVEIRRKYGFMAQETRWLVAFAEDVSGEAAHQAGGEIPVDFTPRSLVAFWGRVLANLDSKRARRKLKPHDIALREDLAARLKAGAAELFRRQPEVLDRELTTRRAVEASWMREQLGIEQATEPATTMQGP